MQRHLWTELGKECARLCMQFAILPERQRPYQVKCKNKAQMFQRKTCLKWYLLCNLSILKIYCLTDSTSVIYEKRGCRKLWYLS